MESELELCETVLTFELVNESKMWLAIQIKAIELYFPVVLFVIRYTEQGGSNVWICGWNPKLWPCNWKLLSSTFLWCCLLCWYKVILPFGSVAETLDYKVRSFLLPLNLNWTKCLNLSLIKSKLELCETVFIFESVNESKVWLAFQIKAS